MLPLEVSAMVHRCGTVLYGEDELKFFLLIYILVAVHRDTPYGNFRCYKGHGVAGRRAAMYISGAQLTCAIGVSRCFFRGSWALCWTLFCAGD